MSWVPALLFMLDQPLDVGVATTLSKIRIRTVVTANNQKT